MPEKVTSDALMDVMMSSGLVDCGNMPTFDDLVPNSQEKDIPFVDPVSGGTSTDVTYASTTQPAVQSVVRTLTSETVGMTTLHAPAETSAFAEALAAADVAMTPKDHRLRIPADSGFATPAEYVTHIMSQVGGRAEKYVQAQTQELADVKDKLRKSESVCKSLLQDFKSRLTDLHDSLGSDEAKSLQGEIIVLKRRLQEEQEKCITSLNDMRQAVMTAIGVKVQKTSGSVDVKSKTKEVRVPTSSSKAKEVNSSKSTISTPKYRLCCAPHDNGTCSYFEKESVNNMSKHWNTWHKGMDYMEKKKELTRREHVSEQEVARRQAAWDKQKGKST